MRKFFTFVSHGVYSFENSGEVNKILAILSNGGYQVDPLLGGYRIIPEVGPCYVDIVDLRLRLFYDYDRFIFVQDLICKM